MYTSVVLYRVDIFSRTRLCVQFLLSDLMCNAEFLLGSSVEVDSEAQEYRCATGVTAEVDMNCFGCTVVQTESLPSYYCMQQHSSCIQVSMVSTYSVSQLPSQCSKCRAFEANGVCLSMCPANMYNNSQTCLPCSDTCLGRCSGPGAFLGVGGCDNCSLSLLPTPSDTVVSSLGKVVLAAHMYGVVFIKFICLKSCTHVKTLLISLLCSVGYIPCLH